MKNSLMMAAASMLLAGSAFAQTAPATPAAAHPKAMSASGAVHVMCKDGTTFDGASRDGACSGHHGIDKKATAAMTAAAPTKSAPLAGAAPKKAAPAVMEQAAGGGAGKVWVNTSSKVYHCQSDKYYGKTKHGEYMMEADAKTKGFHVAHGKACAA